MIQNSNILIYVLDKADLATKQKTQRVGLQLFREKSQIRISSPQYHTDYSGKSVYSHNLFVHASN